MSVLSSTFLLSAPLSLPPISGCISRGGEGNLGKGLWAGGEAMNGGFLLSTFLLSAPLSLPLISGCISCGGEGNLGEGLWAGGEAMSGGFSVAGGVSDGRILLWKVNWNGRLSGKFWDEMIWS